MTRRSTGEALAARAAGSAAGLLGKLMAVVRPEFRADVLVADSTNPMIGPGKCTVAGCDRSINGNGLCSGHRQRWVKAGRPELAEFVATADPRWRRQQPNLACQVEGCGYGSARKGLCDMHAYRWRQAGETDLATWLASQPQVTRPPDDHSICRVGHCQLWPEVSSPFCRSHYNTWKVNGRPDIEEFIDRFAVVPMLAAQQIRLDVLPPQLKLEVQYALQCRYDDRRSKIQPPAVTRVINLLSRSEAASLTEAPEPSWRHRGNLELQDTTSRAFLTYAVRKIVDLVEADGWAAEYPRDVWQLHRLGSASRGTVRFTGIAQPWLRELTKRWVRWRLSSGLGPDAAAFRPALAITRFSAFLTVNQVAEPAGVNRLLLERYLADLHAAFAGSNQNIVYLGQLSLFLTAVRRHGWAQLPADAIFYSTDFPKRAERLPRALADQVMAQVEQPANLDRWNNPAYRLVTLILIRCGLRVTDALRLPIDCVVTDADGAAYLRYYNHKMKREALVPIDEQLQALINEQRRKVAARWPDTARLLFPRQMKNIDGTQPLGSSTYRLALYRWLQRCDVRDEHGKPTHFTPHQWRHTFGTTLINRDVPQEVVRRLLDHESPLMTGHYARLHDTTVRRHWEQARKVNIQGAEVVLDPAGPLGDAAWAKQRLGRATQALPNGYCGLPVQKTCPHANACLTCPMFITTAEFLPQHRQQHRQILQIISAAEARGQTRLIEMNHQVADNLQKIITSLEADDQGQEAVADAS